ncbi:MAG: F0F1 ATP synthase subunit B [Planctomycetota bacterium]
MRTRLVSTLTAAFAAALPATLAFAADEKGGDPKSNLFSSDVFSYIWNLCMFLVLLFVLWKFVWPQILSGLQAREAKQRHDLETAEAKAKEAEEAAEQRKAELATAQKDAQAVIAQAKTDAEQIAAKLKADTEAEITRMKQRAEADIATAKEQALAELFDKTAELSTQIAGRILQREINPEDQQQLVSESLQELAGINRN